MIDIFSKEDFEQALPCIKNTRQTLWSYSGLIEGEHQYVVPVKPGIVIQIRSSVKADGRAADCGEDSIRCWLADPNGKPLGSKYGRWVTRVPGWQERLTKVLRTLWTFGRKLTNCPRCNFQMKAFKAKGGKHEGRWYMKCMNCHHWDSWLEEPKKQPEVLA